MDAFMDSKNYELNAETLDRIRRRQNYFLSFTSSKTWERLVIYSFIVLLMKLIFNGLLMGLHYFEYISGFNFYIAEFKVFVFFSIAISFIFSFFIYQVYRAGKARNKLGAINILHNSNKTFVILRYMIVILILSSTISLVFLAVNGAFLGVVFSVFLIAGLIIDYWFFTEIVSINSQLSKILLNRNIVMPKTINIRKSIKAVVIFNLVALFGAIFNLLLSMFSDVIDPGDLLFRLSIYIIAPTIVFIAFMVNIYTAMKEFDL